MHFYDFDAEIQFSEKNIRYNIYEMMRFPTPDIERNIKISFHKVSIFSVNSLQHTLQARSQKFAACFYAIILLWVVLKIKVGKI